MDKYIKRQQEDIRILKSISLITEEGDINLVSKIIEKRGGELASKIKNFLESAKKDYIKDYYGENNLYNGLSMDDILDKEVFGREYLGKYLQEEIDRKKVLISDRECRFLEMIY